MLLIMEKYHPWLRGGKRGSRGGLHPLIFEARFQTGVMATVHGAFSLSAIPLVVFFARRNTAFYLFRSLLA